MANLNMNKRLEEKAQAQGIEITKAKNGNAIWTWLPVENKMVGFWTNTWDLESMKYLIGLHAFYVNDEQGFIEDINDHPLFNGDYELTPLAYFESYDKSKAVSKAEFAHRRGNIEAQKMTYTKVCDDLFESEFSKADIIKKYGTIEKFIDLLLLKRSYSKNDLQFETFDINKCKEGEIIPTPYGIITENVYKRIKGIEKQLIEA